MLSNLPPHLRLLLVEDADETVLAGLIMRYSHHFGLTRDVERFEALFNRAQSADCSLPTFEDRFIDVSYIDGVESGREILHAFVETLLGPSKAQLARVH